jgi:hypothetical protein
MRTALDADSSRLDQHELNFVANIRKHGWFCTTVFGDKTGPGFSYTTGFWLSLNFPEIIMFSIKRERAHDTLWDLYREIKSGQRFNTREPVRNVFVNLEAVLLPVPVNQFASHLGWSRWFYGGDTFQCLQLVWPDQRGTFPWQHGFPVEMLNAQPDLTNANWSGLGRH